MSRPVRNLLAAVDRPSYVKTAAEQPHYGDAYPVGTREQVFVSCLRASDSAPERMPDLMKYAAFWNIEKDVEKALAQLKTASVEVDPSDSHYALVQKVGETWLKKFAAVDQESTVAAGQAFYAHRHRYPLAWRKEAATRLLSFGDTHGVRWPETVGRYLEKAAGFGYPSAESLQEAIVQRINATPAKHKDLCLKFANALDAIAESPDARHDDELIKMALEETEAYDNATGLNKRYGQEVGLPEDMLTVLAGDLRKLAAANHDVQLMNGAVVDASRIPTDVLLAVDEGLAKLALADLEETLPTLPRPDADTLVRLMA